MTDWALDGDQYTFLEGTLSLREIECALGRSYGWKFEPIRDPDIPLRRQQGTALNLQYRHWLGQQYQVKFRERLPRWAMTLDVGPSLALIRTAIRLNARIPQHRPAHIWVCGTMNARVRLQRLFGMSARRPIDDWLAAEFMPAEPLCWPPKPHRLPSNRARVRGSGGVQGSSAR